MSAKTINTTTTQTLLLCLLSSMPVNSALAESEEILKVKKSTFVNLVDLLVKRGVINQQEGQGLLSSAEQEAAALAAPAKPGESDTGQLEAGKPQANLGAESAQAAKKATAKSKHVTYVPEFVKNEIRDQLRAEIKDQVVSEVKQDAKKEGWGVPGALPDWVASINPRLDFRVRMQNNFFQANNASNSSVGPFNYLQINADGGLNKALSRNSTDAYLNTQKNQLVLRERLRLGFETDITEGLKTGIRFATSNVYNPVSNDQALGNTGQSYQFAIDRSYLQYDAPDTHTFSLYAGRIINPFLSTDVVFDPDLSFEGVAGSFRFHFNQTDARVLGYKPSNPTGRVGINQGQQTPDSLFVTLGVFPIQNVNFSTNSKWLYAGQVGADWLLFENSRLNIAGAYYEYQNISARYNRANGNGHDYDWTAPQFLQHGNSMVAITDIFSGTFNSTCTDASGCLFGLASGFRIFNLTAVYDYLFKGQTHILFTADYAKNLGFNQQQIFAQFHQTIVPRTTAYQVRIDVGQPLIARFGDWNFNLAYRYIQRDAVLDAFTDSIFHQGGTDAKGWVLGTQYGLAKNTWLNMQWYSTDAIDGAKYSVDTLNLDVNTRF